MSVLQVYTFLLIEKWLLNTNFMKTKLSIIILACIFIAGIVLKNKGFDSEVSTCMIILPLCVLLLAGSLIRKK